MTGLDINVKFNSVSSFEFNPAISLLDILKIKIFHLWVIDSSDPLYEQICEPKCNSAFLYFYLPDWTRMNEIIGPRRLSRSPGYKLAYFHVIQTLQ